MPTQNDVVEKLDFLVQTAKDNKEICDAKDKEAVVASYIFIAILSILLMLITGLFGYYIGYQAGTDAFAQEILMTKMGIL